MQIVNNLLDTLTLAVPSILKPLAPAVDLSKSPGYELHDVKETSTGVTGSLRLAGEALDAYGKDIKELELVVEYQSENRKLDFDHADAGLHIHVSDAAKKQFQIPEDSFPRPAAVKSDKYDLEFHHTAQPFAFWVTRRSTSEIIFDTRSQPFIFSDQHLQLSTSLPSSANMYGPGEIVSSSGFRRSTIKDRTTMWNRDDGCPIDQNIYGTHPFYLSSSPSGSFGVFLLNTHAMEMTTKDNVLTYNVLGGTFDFYILSGPSPKDVVRQYSEVVGRPARMPFWAFGLHMCRWNGDWRTPEDVKVVVGKMKEAGVPLETIWSDLDYMDRFRDFESSPTWSREKYQGLIDHLHENNQHYIPIVDAGIAKPEKDDPYLAYDRGTELDVFIKGSDDKEYVGEVWPGDAVYPDWTAKNVQGWWQECFDHYKGIAAYDGIWLDMNEPSNFHMGLKRANGDLKNPLDFPPYMIKNGYKNFWDKTISPSAKLADGYNHYHEHNIWAHEQNLATHKVLLEQSPNQRPFVITRSNFAGTGRVSGHWLGDNYSTWESMRQSIQGVLQFQLFQIPMVGADACGFADNCTEELANRWMQMAAFTPFYRNHNAEGCSNQEPYTWSSVAEASKKVLHTRYQLLPYWETLFTQANKDGTPPIRPLFFEFNKPELAGVEEQFLVGGDLLITPVLHKGKKEVKGHFPEAGGVWRDWYTHKALEIDSNNQATLPTPLGNINVHIRPGSIILIHTEPAYTLTDTRKADYGLIIALDGKGEAAGVAILDDGLSVEGAETVVKFSVTAGARKLNIENQGDYKGAPALTKVTILGAGEGDEEKKVLDVKVDLSEGGEVEW